MSGKVVMTESKAAIERKQIALLGSETNQQLSLRVQDILPGEGTPLHMHIDQAETFHVVKGTFRFCVNDQEIIANAGFTVHIPKGTPHAFLYEDEEHNGQLISILTPGIHDGFITKVPEEQENGASLNELMNLAETYGAKILGPGLKPKN